MTAPTLSDAEVIRRYEQACQKISNYLTGDPDLSVTARTQANWERWHAEVLRRGLMGQVKLK